MEELRRNGASLKKRSKSGLRQKMRVLRRTETKVAQETPKKISLMEEKEEYTRVTFCTSSYMKKKVFIHKNENYTVSIYTCRRYPLSPVSKPYDPLTNNFSPRPKFLMCNPDKQREENLEEMGLSDSHEDGLESTGFEDNSDEGVHEEKQGMLYKVMKFLFVLCAFVFPTLYTWSMYSPKTGHLLSLQGYHSFQDPANDFAWDSLFLNQTSGKESSFREATKSVILEKSIDTSDLLKVFVNENVVEQILEVEDSSKLSDPPDLDEKREIAVEILRVPYANDIQGLLEVLPHEKVTACEGTGEEEMVSEDQVETVVNTLEAIGAKTKLQDADIVDKIDSSGEYAKMGEFSYKIDEKRIILGDMLSTCEIVDSARGLGDDQNMRTEAMVTDVVLVMGGIASLLGGISLLAIALRLVWRVLTKPSERIPSPVTQECVEPVPVEDSRDLLLGKTGESTKEKDQFAVEQRLIELCHFRAPTAELLGDYVVSPEFSRSSLKKCTHISSPVEAQKTKREIFPDSPSVSASCSNKSLDTLRRFDRDKIVREEEGSTTALRRSARTHNMFNH